MIRTTIAVALLLFAVLFLPFWVQIVLFAVAIFLVHYRLWLLLPALVSDAWYAPTRSFSVHTNKMVLLVLGMLIMYTLIVRNTRITQRYGLEKK